jgi:hypothetical protein
MHDGQPLTQAGCPLGAVTNSPGSPVLASEQRAVSQTCWGCCAARLEWNCTVSVSVTACKWCEVSGRVQRLAIHWL